MNLGVVGAQSEDAIVVCRWHRESRAGRHWAALHRLLGVAMECALSGMIRAWVEGTKRMPLALMRTAEECTRRKAMLFLCHTTGRLMGSEITTCG